MITLFSEEQIMEVYEKELREDIKKEVVDETTSKVTNNTALRLIRLGVPEEDIIEGCQLSRDEFDALKKEVDK